MSTAYLYIDETLINLDFDELTTPTELGIANDLEDCTIYHYTKKDDLITMVKQTEDTEYNLFRTSLKRLELLFWNVKYVLEWNGYHFYSANCYQSKYQKHIHFASKILLPEDNTYLLNFMHNMSIPGVHFKFSLMCYWLPFEMINFKKLHMGKYDYSSVISNYHRPRYTWDSSVIVANGLCLLKFPELTEFVVCDHAKMCPRCHICYTDDLCPKCNNDLDTLSTTLYKYTDSNYNYYLPGQITNLSYFTREYHLCVVNNNNIHYIDFTPNENLFNSQ